ncbi:glycosyltransferase [Roseomonas sp. OT10]|uniref:glycosyltransferase n=1 Tax=Roseomonas cutis TaxID=2897332 RepID=UPI001E57E3EA|nr:glycosyltransferase [Roseomonas sp. OT10]UFN46902.1 glycosyltransferase [Roseomonas sp. OT10]
MKIALVAHLKYPIVEPFAGGLEMHTHLLARHLIARGHDVTLFAAEGSDRALNLRPCGAPTGMPNTPREAEAIALLEHQAYAGIVDAITAGGFDIVHNNALHYLPLDEARRIAAPMVTSLHTPPFRELADAVANPGHADLRFIAVSDTVAAMWRDIVAVPDVVPNGIELDLFRPRLEGPVAGHAIWFGRLVPEKGAHLAIAAARRAGVPLRLAGPRNDPAYWTDHIAPALGEGVSYLGHLDHAALAEQVAAAAVAVITPRWEEPYGLVVAEALACGTPVAGFARGALPEIVDAWTGCLAPADDIAALARAIPAAAALSRTDCRRRAEERCDARSMVSGYEALYRAELVSREAQEAAALAAK